MALGDFTNIRVESIAWDTNILRYDYANTNTVSIYRNVSGGAYSLLLAIPNAYGSSGSPFYDASLTEQIVYGYKLSDDAGATFTTPVTVKTQKRWPAPTSRSDRVSLPAFATDADVTPYQLQNMADQLQTLLNGGDIAAPRPCNVCPVDGALVLDCSTGCYRFIVDATDITDVNSISVNCESLEVDFDVPDGTTIEVCGWPQQTAFTGDECLQAPISSGVSGFQVVMAEQLPCPNSRTRLTSAPCKGDYIYECWDTDSLYRSGVIRNVPASSCGCSTIGEGIKNKSIAASPMTVFSGRSSFTDKEGHKGYAGMSMLYKRVNSSCVGVPAAATVIDYQQGSFIGPVVSAHFGKPIVGFAINVPVGATIRNFTGHVLLFDYPHNLYVWGRYTNADLHSGAMPTTIATIAMSVMPDPTNVQLIMEGPPGGVYTYANVFLENGVDPLQYIAQTLITFEAEPLGFGLIWVANNTDNGTHWATFGMDYEQAILWW